MSTKKGLGKGLDVLIRNDVIPETEDKDVSRETLVNINKVEPNRTQPRKNFEEDALDELADSIKQHGIIQPIIVQKHGDMYEIIAGERRWRAARLAGLKQVPVVVKEYSEQEVFEIALIENIQRQDLNPVEEALAYARLVEEYHLKQEEVAERVGKNRVTVTNSLRLLKLDPRVQQMMVDGRITGGHARALLPINDPEEQYKIATKIVDEKNITVRDVEKLVKKLKTEKEKTPEIAATSEDSFIYHDLEEKMKTAIGSKVSIHRKKKDKGRIEIEYYSSDELERIVDMLTRLR